VVSVHLPPAVWSVSDVSCSTGVHQLCVWSVSDVSCFTGVRLRIFLFLLTADGLSRTALLQVDSLYSYTRVFTNVHQHFVLTHDFLFFKLNFIKAFLKYFLDRLV